MTHATRPAPLLTAARPGRRAGIPAAALAALLLAGCSTGHIGESWQCPLAEGGACDSVAAADPAVPDPAATRAPVLAEPLWRVRGHERAGPAPDAAPSCEAECDAFDPFAWLARLFDGGDPGSSGTERGGEGADREDAITAAAGPAAADPSASGAAVREAEASPPAPGEPAPGTAEPASAALPAEGGPSRDGPAQDGPEADELRTGEIVARIWIAPFVDANGVYREASHVRVVLEPAGWRIP